MPRYLFIILVVLVFGFGSCVLGPEFAYATHQEDNVNQEGMIEVERNVEGQETEESVSKLEKQMKEFSATTVTREEITGHIFNYFQGFSFRFGITGVLQGSFNNAKNDTATAQAENSLDGTGSLDLVIARQFFNHGLGLVHFEAGVGNGLNQMPIFNSLLFGRVNREATPQARRLEVAEAYYEGNYLDSAFNFSMGWLDPTVYFDTNDFASDETTQYLNGGFRNNTAFELPGNSFAAQVTGTPCDWFYIKGGVWDASASGYDIEDNIFWSIEAGFTPTIGELDGTYRIYGWQNRSDHTDINNGRTNDYGMGIGVSIGQLLTKWLGLFARGGYQSPSIYQVKMAFSGGLALLGNLYSREYDRLGVAYGVAINNNKFSPGKNEHVIEVYYRLAVAKGHVGLSPDVQFIINPSGQYGRHNVVAAGVRAQVDF